MASQIAVIICSSRKPRVCPQIADFVIETVIAHSPSIKNDLTIIDLAEQRLPFYDEPNIPSQIKDHTGYEHKHTRKWSLEIQKYQGFIFVLPQYNWGYPAILKNAIDFLFYEWKNKAAMIVSYGGHGGGKSAGQLHQVLEGVGMKVAETMPALSFGSKEVTAVAASGKKMPPMGGEGGLWVSKQGDIQKAFDEFSDLLPK
jgi:NAD(P)H-dependent FMN reductase